MLLHIPHVLTREQVGRARELLLQAEWVDGRVTAGPQSSRAKQNLQLREDSPEARNLGDQILGALHHSALFMSAALPLKIFPPLFNRYSGGHSFGSHVDNAIRQVSGTPHRVRTDLSATLFFVDPDTYRGGELIIQDTYGAHSVKLPAGDLVLYPSTSLHHVTPVTEGERLASFFWIQSLVRDDGRRTLLFEMDSAIQRLARDTPDHPSTVQLTGVYHNLLRQWAEL
jgi:PKHD-type hydroxylase